MNVSFTNRSNALKLAHYMYNEIVLYPWESVGLHNWVGAIYVIRINRGRWYARLVCNSHYSEVLSSDNPCVPIWDLGTLKYIPVPDAARTCVLTFIQEGKYSNATYIIFDEDLGVTPDHPTIGK